VFPGPDISAVFEDFLGDTVADEWQFVEGDTGYSGTIVTGSGGVFRITGSETQGVAPTSAAALTQGAGIANWKPNAGGAKASWLHMCARVKLGTITRTAKAGRTYAFIGFSDTGGAEMPAYDTGAGILTPAANAMGFLFSPAGDTGWTAVSAKSTAGDSGDQSVVCGSSYGPSANTYTTLEIDYRAGPSDTGGQAVFSIDGRRVAAINSPVNSATALAPWLGGFIQDTGYAGTIDIDFVNVSNKRDTGV
jgi:hypothetical protein